MFSRPVDIVLCILETFGASSEYRGPLEVLLFPHLPLECLFYLKDPGGSSVLRVL